MTQGELAARLADVRIPESFARFALQDALAACALGLLTGLAISVLLRSLTVRRTRPVDEARSAIAALVRREHQVRITGLAALLRANGGTAPDGMCEALYNPRASLDPATLEAAVLSAARKRPRK